MKRVSFDETIDGQFYWLVNVRFVRDVVVEREGAKIRSLRRGYDKESFAQIESKGAQLFGPLVAPGIGTIATLNCENGVLIDATKSNQVITMSEALELNQYLEHERKKEIMSRMDCEEMLTEGKEDDETTEA